MYYLVICVWLRDSFQFLWNNLDNSIAMIICIVAGVYSFGKDPADPILLTSITWALGLLAFGSIKDRTNRQKLQKHIATLNKASATLVDRTKFLRFEDVTASAQEI
jgi:hypothetical protein